MSINAPLAFAKCACQHCHGHFEIPEEYLEEVRRCPHCGENTFLRRIANRMEPSVPELKRWWRHKAIWILAAILGVTLLTAAAFRLFGHQIEELAVGSFGTIGGIVAIGIFLIVAWWAVLWLILPFVIFFGFQMIERQTKAGNDLLRRCHQQLEKIAEREDR